MKCKLLWIPLLMAWMLGDASHFRDVAAQSPEAPPAPSSAPPAPAPLSNDQIEAWIEALGSPEFETRDRAMASLAGGGKAVIPWMLKTARRRDPEIATRAVMILKGIGERGDLDTLESAIDALGTTALGTAGTTPLTRPAMLAKSRLESLRQDRAMAYFRGLGATVDPQFQDHSWTLVGESLFSVEIGPEWKGTRRDLDRLRWLYDVEQISLIGPQVTDDWLLSLHQLPNLISVKIKRAAITARGIEELAKLPQLRALRLLFLSVGDEAVGPLLKCDQVVRLVVVSPKLTADGTQRLKDHFDDRIDVPRGALLGVTAWTEEPWYIKDVLPGSAADKAGLLVRDRIIKFNDTPVATFSELKTLIGKCNPGDTAAMDVERGNRLLKLQITFGEWD